jgi:predicted nucleic acid-binding protein
MAIFVDTWAWAALFDAANEGHEATSRFVREAFTYGETFITTNFVLCEAITLLFGRLGSRKGERFLDDLEAVRKLPQCSLEEITPERFEKGMLFRRRYLDKPDISFTDLTSMVVMRELGIRDILTGDRHFAQVNLGFRLVPEHQ